MIRIFSVNEISIFSLALSALLGRRAYVLAVDPIIPRFAGILERLVEKLVQRGRIGWLPEFCPSAKWLWEYPSRGLMHDVFARTEALQNRRFRFSEVDRFWPAFATAYKKAVCNYLKPRHFHVVLIETLYRQQGREPIRFIGFPADTAALLNEIVRDGSVSGFRAMPIPAILWNLPLAFAALLFGTAWIVSRIRPIPPVPKPFFFAADYIGDSRDVRLYREMQEGGEVLLVPRTERNRPEAEPDLGDFAVARLTDGRFSIIGGLREVSAVAMGIFQALRHFGGRHPALFMTVVTLAQKRAIQRGFFNVFRPCFFWGRDDYNVEHIFRTDALHAIGGSALGLLHGYPSYAHLFPMWRYIKFDAYFLFGREIERYYRDTWPRDMTAIPAGSYGAAREDYDRRDEPKPNDIVVFAATNLGRDSMVDFVREVAEAFPERTVYLEIKSYFHGTEDAERFVEACTDGLTNVRPTDAPLMDLTRMARYALCDPSTVVVETLQFGQVSFMIDILPEHRECMFRNYPGLCMTSAGDTIRMIRDIEAGKAVYPRGNFGNLVDLSGRVFFDQVRERVGLSAKSAARPLPDVTPDRDTASLSE